MMAETTLAESGERSFAKYEFYAFSIISFAAKSWLLLRLPYRDWWINAFYTTVLLSWLYGYFRLRQNIKIPPLIIAMLATAVALDVLGNYYGLYGHEFGPLQYDEFTHFFGSGFSLVPVMWLLRATTRRMGHRLPLNLIAFLAVAITFSFCAYYEILELWDQKYYGMPRIHGELDTSNDLQFDLIGILLFTCGASLVFKLSESRKRRMKAEG